MEKKTIRKMALTLALMKLLSFGPVKAEDAQAYYYIKDGKLVTTYSFEELISNGTTYVDPDTTVSFFNNRNLLSDQYGGNQMDFINNFDDLIKDPLIWEEMQKHYPVSEFASEECAMDFYREYFRLLAECGCGYVATADKIFHAYEGQEDKFLATFGYPMYVVDEEGRIDFNYEIFTLGFFNYSVLYPKYSEKAKVKIKKSLAKTLAEIELKRYENSPEYHIVLPTRPTPEQLEEAFAKKRKAQKKYDELYEKWRTAEDNYLDLSLALEAEYGHLKQYMKTFGVNIEVKYVSNARRKYNPGDILASEDFTLYNQNFSGTFTYADRNIGAHYFYVVGYDEEGRLVVSSWGNKYVFDDTEADWVSKIVLKIK